MHLVQIVIMITIGMFLIGEACCITLGVIYIRRDILTTGGHDVYPCTVTILEQERGSKCVALHCSTCYIYKYLFNVSVINVTINKTTDCVTTSDVGSHRCYVLHDNVYIYDNSSSTIGAFLVLSLVGVPFATMIFGVALYFSTRMCIRSRCCGKHIETDCF